MERKCGDCTACCTVMGVPELEKPGDEKCPNEGAKGCGIYGSRPESCRGYECLWLRGEFNEDERPDQVGLLFNRGEIVGVGDVMMGRVVVDDSIMLDPTNAATTMVARLTRSEDQIVSVRRTTGDTSLLGRPEKMQAFISRSVAQAQAQGDQT